MGSSEIYNSAPVLAETQTFYQKNTSSLSIANEYYQQGKYSSAIAELEKSIPELSDDLLRGEAYNNLAAAYFQIGNTPVAIDNWNQALDLFEKIQSAEHITKATISLSQAYVNVGLSSLAIPRLTRAIALIEERPQLGYVLAIARGVLAKAYSQTGQLEKAVSQYQLSLNLNKDPLVMINLSLAYKALAIQNQNLAVAARETAFNLSEASNLEKIAQKNYRLAFESAQKALKLADEQGLISQIDARVYFLEFLNEKIPNLNASNSNSDLDAQKSQLTLDALALLDKVPNSSFKAKRLIQIAIVLSDAQALPILNRASIMADKISDRRSQSIALREIGQIYLQQKKYNQAEDFTLKGIIAAEVALASDNLFLLFWQIGKIHAAKGEKTDAMKSYNSALWNLQSNRDHFTVGKSNLFFQLRKKVNPFLREYAGLLLSGEPTQKELQKAIETISLLKISELQIFFNDPCFENIVEVVTAQVKISSSLASKELEIYSLILDKRTYLIVKKPDNSFQVYTVALDSQKLSKEILLFLKNLKNRSHQNYVFSSQSLYKLLIAPLERDLKEIDPDFLVFVHDGILRNIPMEVLLDDRKFLVEKYPIIYQTGLNLTETSKIKNREALIFGLSEKVRNFSALPFVRQEVALVEKIIGGKTFVDRDFTGTQLARNIEKEEYSVLHIATHGVFGGSAENSFLLAIDEKINLKQFNNILLNSSNNIQLLTLSACSTLPTSEQATLGFGGVALRNGVKNVLGTLWAINDEKAIDFIKDFYEKAYTEKLSLAEAKRQVQIEFISQDLHPFFWGSNILVTSY